VVLRDPEQGGAVRVEGLRAIELDGRIVSTIAWAGPSELAVLAGDAGGAAAPFRVGLSTVILNPAGIVPGAESLAAATGEGLAIGTDDGQVLQQNATLGWVELGVAETPVYPG
jgi:hypothetical protein